MKTWQKAQRQARAIGKTKTPAGKRRAVLNWCKKVKAALR